MHGTVNKAILFLETKRQLTVRIDIGQRSWANAIKRPSSQSWITSKPKAETLSIPQTTTKTKNRKYGLENG